MTEVHFEEEEFDKRLDWSLWRKLLRRIYGYKRFLLPLIGVAITFAAAETCFTLLTKAVIDDVELNGGEGLVFWGVAFVGLVILNVVGIFAFIHLAGNISIGMSCDIRQEAFDRLQKQEFAYFDTRPVGWLMARLTSDCDTLARTLAWGTLDTFWGSARMLGIVIFMLILDWRLALIVVSVMPVVVLVSLWFQKRILRTARHARKLNSRLTATYAEGILGARTTKSLVREEENLVEFRKQSGEMFRVSFRNALYTAAYLPLVLTLLSIGTGLALWFGGVDTLKGVITLGTLVAFIAATSEFMWPIFEIARVFTELQIVQASAERVIGVIEREPGIQDEGRKEPDRIESIQFDHVDFAYEEDQPVLEDFNLKVHAGETIALVGPTGGGKSTVVSLLCRFYEPVKGIVRINGEDYRNHSLSWLYGNLGIVQQEPRLFSGTIRENIRYGRLDASDAEVEIAAQQVNAHDFISELAKGYDTQVGEGGVRLSTGQKQLLSLARAILADPQIMILDEATASVDTETERLIQDSVDRVLAGRMSFVIAHRLSTIRRATCILVIEGGRIVESGTHPELIAKKARYYDLYTNQFLKSHETRIVEGGGPTESV